MTDGLELKPGYIGAVVETNPVVKFLLRTLFSPVTYEIHHFIVGDYMPYLDDWQVLESITSKGCSARMLKEVQRDGKPIVFYKHIGYTPYKGKLMVSAWWKLSGKRYDYLGILKFLFHMVRWFPYKARPWAFPYKEDKTFWCTEIVEECGEEAGMSFVPWVNVWPHPWSFKVSQDMGVMVCVGKR